MGRPAHPDHLPLGETCPAVVLGRSPWLIAVGTDLNAAGPDGAPCPAIAIVSQPLDLMTGGPPPVGARLAAAALHHGRAGARWERFDPVVAGCGCTDEDAIARALASIPGETWASFLDLLRGLPRPYRAGTLHIFTSDRRVGAARPPLRRPARPAGTAPEPPTPAPAVYRMSLGVAGIVVAFLGGLGAALVATYETWWAVAGALPFWAGAGWLVWTFARRSVEVGPDGFAWSDKGHVERAAWSDVIAYNVDAVVGAQGDWHELAQNLVAHWRERRGHRFSKATDKLVLVLDLHDGRALALHQTYARSFDLFETILDQADPRIAPEFVLRVLQGETVDCGGGLALAPYGVVSGEVWAWDEVAGVGAIDGRVIVAARGQRVFWEKVRSPGAVAWALDALRLREDPGP
jgi:hypothetical protein